MSKIILALDEALDISILNSLSDHLYGIKIGYPLLLKIGVSKTKDLLQDFIKKEKEIILDLKLADIDNTMKNIISQLDFADSYIAHAFIGIEGALDEIKKYTYEKSKKLYLVASMSHKGWNDDFYPYIKDIISKIDPYGIVAPGTKLQMLKTIRNDFPNKIIISPGIGVQGGKFGDALCFGANYEIIGRSIYNSIDPLSRIKEIEKIQEETLNECKRSNN
ncbi:orotidine 5'-phosphate decarboxylase / HUMPS family protein [Acidianus sulfidivorans]|uniref:orotidine 5'-phosphate decarboxylase / HUMPS family protein n=1 Tax=Acidianus sulfidivorans TaxID=312539 RepID=UPI0026BB2EE4